MADPLRQFKRKSAQQLGYLHDYYYHTFQDVQALTIAEDTRSDKRRIPDFDTWEKVAIGAHWSGRDRYYWLHFTVQVPTLSADPFVIHMNLGRTGDGNNSKYEGLMFVNGQVRQAVDSNHEDAYFNADFSGQTLDIYIKMWTGLEGGGPQKIQHYTLKSLCFGVLNQTVVQTYDYLSNIVGVIGQLDVDEPLRYAYLNLMTSCFDQFNWAQLDDKSITPVCLNVLNQIKAFIAAHPGQKKAYQITAVGHTHIDVAWLWRLKHTREKVARSFSTVLELMNEYPDYVFFQSTPQDYAFLAEDYPELFDQIQQRIKEGRWEANGGTWLEPDTNIPSGESLTRQFLYGSQYFKEHFDAKQNVLWLPDVFGYSAATPQIMHQFGIDNFMTTKISWNDTNRMPHDTFKWQGIDGTQVLTHFITTVETGTDFGDRTEWRYTYNGELIPQTVFGSYHVYADKGLNDDILVSYGYGDGGGGPNREQIKNRQILNELPGVPTVVPGRVDDYFDRLNQKVVEHPEQLATWRGELYLEYHRGTYTSQARVKQANRQAEYALRDLEMRYTMAHITQGVSYPTEAIKALWVILLRNQFHDILPGSAIHEVYDDAKIEFGQLFDGVAELNAQLDKLSLTPKVGNNLISNDLPWTRTGLVTLDGELQSVKVPALSSISLTETSAPTTKTTAQIGEHTIETPFYCVTYADDGHVTSLYDLRLERELFTEAGGNVLTVYEDRPLDFNNWNIDADYPQKATVLQADAMDLTANTANYVDLTTTYHYGESTLKQVMRLYAKDPRIDFITDIDWHQHEELLRTAFNTQVLADNARFDIQYGNVLRPTNDNTSWDQAKFETVAHKWADLSEPDYGIALLNNAKYGYRVKDQQLSMTLLTSGIDPDTQADQGAHHFTYSLLPHAGNFAEGQVEQAAEELNQPLTVAQDVAGDVFRPLISFDQEAIALDAVKMAESGDYAIVRVHEYLGRNATIKLKLNFDAQAVYAGLLNETADTSENLLHDGHVEIELHPYQIVTLMIKL